MNKQTEALKLALKRAFNLGQTYWQQADSEYTSQWKKADVTLASFNQLLEDTIQEALAQERGSVEQPAQQESEAVRAAWMAGYTEGERDAIEKAQQEPVAWLYPDNLGRKIVKLGAKKPIIARPETAEPLYTSPPSSKPWVGLTDEEIEKGRDQTFSINNPYCPCDSKTMRKAVRWAEAKLREKNV